MEAGVCVCGGGAQRPGGGCPLGSGRARAGGKAGNWEDLEFFFTKQDGNLGNPEFGKQVRKDEDTPGPPTPPQPPRQPHLIPRALSRGWGEEKAHLG